MRISDWSSDVCSSDLARAEVLQLMALFFHAHARRKLAGERVVERVALSPREFECLRRSAQGKSAWEIGCILGISRRTVSLHLDNAKATRDVRTVRQAAVRHAASQPTRRTAERRVGKACDSTCRYR